MSESTPRGGLYASLRGLLSTALGLLQNRLELLAVEVHEEKTRLAGLVAYGVAAVLLLCMGLAFLAVLITVWLWDSNRLLALGAFAALFLIGGCCCLIAARRLLGTPSTLFSASIAELKKDRTAADNERETT
jgi:uncharacterized membrane protein YqjE